ncbi:hypothetical protein C0Q70_11527 [Pomacea canaliculata]|uniref:Uncharacterized protein n=1 Tax=Pomacea canaliculata TaxID=400727 RepID=A0A2T7P670_POMCA|nr:hypothetical protein C0Q70_11527 [Pomacea canaliculata]
MAGLVDGFREYVCTTLFHHLILVTWRLDFSRHSHAQGFRSFSNKKTFLAFFHTIVMQQRNTGINGDRPEAL